MMSESFTMLMAQKPVRIELEEPSLAAQLNEWSRGFVVEPVEPWLTVRVRRLPDIVGRPATASVRRRQSGGWSIEAPRARGTLEVGDERVARGEVFDFLSLSQFIYLSLSLLLPDEGMMLLHADAVAFHGRSVMFLGPSGTGKSTAARHMVRNAGAKLLSIDRTVVLADRSLAVVPLVVPTPRLVPGLESETAAFGDPVPLWAAVFPRRGGPAMLRRLTPLEAHQRVLSSVIMPRGEGQPVARALELTHQLLQGLVPASLDWNLTAGGDEMTRLVSRLLEGGDQSRTEPGEA